MKYLQTKLLSIPLVSLSLLATPSWAETPMQGDREFSVSGAGSSDKDFDDSAFAMELTFGQYLSSNSLIGVRQSATVTDSDGTDSNWNGSTRAFYDYHFGQQKLRPYLGANFGYIYGDSVEETFIAGPEAGLKYYVLPSTFIVAQVEYQFMFEDSDDADDRFDDGAFAYSIGIGFNF